MATNYATHVPIKAIGTVSGNTPRTTAAPEKAAQLFYIGTPVQLNAGYVQAWDGATITNGILGITTIPGSNLSTNGAGAPVGFGPIGAPGAIATYGNVPNEPSAVKIALGTPFTDGRTLVELAESDTIWEALVDNTTASTGGNVTPSITDIGKQYGLTADANGLWFVDYNKSTAGTNTVLQIYRLSPVDGTLPNGHVQFTFLKSAYQLFQ